MGYLALRHRRRRWHSVSSYQCRQLRLLASARGHDFDWSDDLLLPPWTRPHDLRITAPGRGHHGRGHRLFRQNRRPHHLRGVFLRNFPHRADLWRVHYEHGQQFHRQPAGWAYDSAPAAVLPARRRDDRGLCLRPTHRARGDAVPGLSAHFLPRRAVYLPHPAVGHRLFHGGGQQ